MSFRGAFFLIGFFHYAITPASVKLVGLAVATSLIISSKEHMPEQHENLYDCDQRPSGMFSEQFK